ncbi:MAG: hydrogenase expression/formation protein [Gammaproteobacteria bacterium]|nr:hydrogenase expression/formation protein [Gammaproteobacteria bacterium]
MSTSSSVLDSFNIQTSHDLTWNVLPLLHQVKHAMDNLLENNTNEIIDLRSIPLAPGEEDNLLKILGQGEVKAQLNALGPSEIIETQYNGVWLITHYNDENEIVSRHIEVTYMPEILLSQMQDIRSSSQRLSEKLSESQTDNSTDNGQNEKH